MSAKRAAGPLRTPVAEAPVATPQTERVLTARSLSRDTATKNG
jgi:hypothetical protein